MPREPYPMKEKEQFETAVACIFSQDASVSAETRTHAQAYCDAIRTNPESWSFCLDTFLNHTQLQVRFWCLQVLIEGISSGRLHADACTHIRTAILRYLQERFAAANERPEIKNKVCVVYVSLIKRDYPDRWASAFSDLMGMLRGGGAALVDMFLRILDTLDTEVVNDDINRTDEERKNNTHIKDAMRVHDVNAIVECWYQVISSDALRQSHPQLVCLCLSVMSKYVPWIEILLVTNSQVLPALLGLMQLQAHQSAALAGEACDVITAVVEKRMDPLKKVSLLRELGLVAAAIESLRAHEDEELLEKQAALLNAIAEQALDSVVKLRLLAREAGEAGMASAKGAVEAWAIVQTCLPYVIAFFGHSNTDICDQVAPFLAEFFAKVKPFLQRGQVAPFENAKVLTVTVEQVGPVMTQVLERCARKAEYPPWYKLDHGEDDRHIAFLEFRRSVTNLYKRAFALHEQTSLAFVRSLMQELCNSAASLKWTQIEVLLHLFYVSGEHFKDISSELKQPDHPFCDSLRGLMACEPVMWHRHPEVRTLLQDIFIRFISFFNNTSISSASYIPAILGSLLDERGLRSPSPKVVGHSSFKLLRLVKLSLTHVAPLTPHIVQSLQPLLTIPYVPGHIIVGQGQAAQPLPKPNAPCARPGSSTPSLNDLTFDDQTYLFEALGQLIGTNAAQALAADQRRQYLCHVLSPLWAPLRDGDLAIKSQGDPQGHADWAARLLMAMGSVSKGFNNVVKECVPEWMACLECLHNAIQVLGGDEKVRQATVFLLRRMLVVMGEAALAAVAALLPRLYAVPQLKPVELSDLAVFLQHIASTYKAQAGPACLDPHLGGAFARHYAYWIAMPEASAELIREKNEHANPFLQALQAIAAFSPTTLVRMLADRSTSSLAHQLRDFTTFYLRACTSEVKNTIGVGYSVGVMDRLVEFSMKQGANAEEALSTLSLTTLLPLLIAAAFGLDPEDPGEVKISADVCSVLRNLVASSSCPPSLTAQLMELVHAQLLGAVKPNTVSPDDVRAFVQRLATQPLPQSKDMFKHLVKTQHVRT